METSYWIIVASRNHVQYGVAGGFAQANHGKSSPLKRMKPGDWIVYYSPKVEYGENEVCQSFTAIGKVKDEPVYQADMGGGFLPFRRNIEYQDCQETSILPLIEQLSFIKDKRHWGAPFRFGVIKISEQDFKVIAAQMLPEEQIANL